MPRRRQSRKDEQRASDAKNRVPEVLIYIMGEPYRVPAGLTVMRAVEHAGYRLIRACGCRGGFCGACATVYRTADSYKLKVGLACQTTIEDGMYLTQIPFYPGNRQQHGIEQASPDASVLLRAYPEIMRCIACNSCTKICPQNLDVMGYINAAIRGDIRTVADMSFDCIMCGLCASRCPAEIVHYNVALLARRVYGAKLASRAGHVAERTREIAAGKFEEELDRLCRMSEAELSRLYYDPVVRDIEP